MQASWKKTIAAFVAGAFIVAGVAAPLAAQAAQAAQPEIRPAQTQRQVDPAQVAERLSATFGVSKLALLKYHAGGADWRDLTRASFLSLVSGKPLDTVMDLKKPDNTWKDVAKALGVTHEQAKVAKQTLLANRLQYQFGIDKNTTLDLLRQGYKPRAVAMASLLAQDAGKPVQDVIKMKTADNKWRDVAQALNVDEKEFRKNVCQLVRFFPHKQAGQKNKG